MMFKQTMMAVTLAAVQVGAFAADHIALKRPVKVPPPVDLTYKIDARQRGFALSGEASFEWRVGGGKYQLSEVTRAVLLGKIVEHRSEGAIDGFGLAPASFYEKRFRKDPSTTVFDRATNTITFSEGQRSYPILGGEQDRSTAAWQLLSVARAAPEKFTPGSQWVFFVAGRYDAEPWSFKVVDTETVHTGLGDVSAVHLFKAPPPDSLDQSVDIWLAPSLEWYPVRLRFSDKNGDFVEQTLERLKKR